MRRFLLLLCLGLSLSLPSSPVRAEEPPRPAPADVDAAIEAGVEWLAEEQRRDGTWGSGSRAVGHTALAVFALLHAGLGEDTDTDAGKALARALRWLDRHGPGVRRADDRGAGVYDMALLVLVERARGRSDAKRTKRLVALLERAQAENGQWSYRVPKGRRPPSAGDNSNTQFAVLALGAAVGEGVSVDPQVLQRAWRWWRQGMQSDGGWGYSSGGSLASASTGSMTAAGIAALAILEAALAGRSPDVGPSDAPSSAVIRRATDRLAAGFRVDRNFGPAQGGAAQRQRNAGRGWLHYYLWSVERAMVLAGHERLGTTDWYAAGVAHLLGSQKGDGSWRGEHPLYATAFALLFLTRAADPPRVFTAPDRPRGTVTEPGGDVTDEGPAPPPLPAGEVVDWLTAGLTPDALLAACRQQGASVLEPLVRALDHADAEVRQRANEALHALLGADRVGTATAHPLARGRLLLWVRMNERRLELRDGRFVLP